MKLLLILCLALGACTQRHYYRDCDESDMNITDPKKKIRTSCFKIQDPYVNQSHLKDFHRDVGITVPTVKTLDNNVTRDVQIK